MSLDIGAAFREGGSRTVAKSGLLLVAAFIVFGVVTLVLTQTLAVGVAEATLEFIQSVDPAEAGLSQAEYERSVSDLQTMVSDAQELYPLAIDLSPGIAAAGLVAVALLWETASIIAVRVFAANDPESLTSGDVSGNLLLATLNGFIGKIVVWGLMLLGFVVFVFPGIFFAVAFYFLRQEIALRDKNFVSGMADSWRLTKGHRIEVFAVALVVVVLSQLDVVLSPLGSVVPQTAVAVLGTGISAAIAVFGAAVVTRLYVQLREEAEAEAEAAEAEKDPYDAALGPDDIPE
ncbi:hypothetical protein HWV23_00295 [Natronomonas halophila]|uniref:hypothetical protein n=1 Tax=Natronomonas halophila TaxID=2747817 RepID=UPI0015B6A5D3|nr:hypothetical protein [Natronomonas halophila]QLD84207.1 hypothetical protein HWV23_00295 [Natronomonas halophila]